MIYIDEAEVRNLISPEQVISALEDAFRQPGFVPPRQRIKVGGGELLIMPATDSSSFGVKLITIADNGGTSAALIQGAYILFSDGNLTPSISFEAGALTAIRTAGVSALATKYLARRNAHRLVLFGAGVEAREHLRFMLSVRSIDWVRVISRTQSRAAELVSYANSLGLDAALGTCEDVTHADIVCTCTTAITPLFPGERLSAGVHINAVGTHRPTERELDTSTIVRGRVVVESRDVALQEAGELCMPIATRAIESSHIAADLRETMTSPVRQTEGDITVFKSVGLAFEDLAVANAIQRNMKNRAAIR